MATIFFALMYFRVDQPIEDVWKVFVILAVCDVITFVAGRESKRPADVAVKVSRPWES